MRKKQLGNSDLTASPIGLGCMGMSEWYGPVNDAESRATIRKALEMGLNFFDTADVYGNGHNEMLVGDVLKDIRQEIILASQHVQGNRKNDAGMKLVNS